MRTPDFLQPIVINPDDYLETPDGRVFTPERNQRAWQHAYAELDTALSKAEPGTRLYLVIGVQGAGKSTWIRNNIERLGNRAIIFDAALPKAQHREKIMALAMQHSVPVTGVLIQASLEIALFRNNCRSADKVVPEDAVRNVFNMLEPPHTDEGFANIEYVDTCAQGHPSTVQDGKRNGDAG
ncbi:hypothetical protein KDX38_19595 [Pseudomonas sp. CDFA 602]|uniref:ATP-binding protein n=1 Tax=Pseudomonas californiensis TaxID=2829823 RepID=UPI001E55D88E|nr:ATP-binding protein [Pseudomonas californiensis]MCD5995738.1 hypothetical protein [Pseudomonas californiensis]MCD6001409.1 hypothetical protein [Pseudomonas californiensis]